jgi:hypothetical protein
MRALTVLPLGRVTDAKSVLLSATITLHNAYINFEDERCRSVERCVDSADAILHAYYIFMKVANVTTSSWPQLITRLHPFVTVCDVVCISVALLTSLLKICWYLAAVVKIQVCKHMIRMGDTVNEFHVWGEINVLRFAVLVSLFIAFSYACAGWR